MKKQSIKMLGTAVMLLVLACCGGTEGQMSRANSDAGEAVPQEQTNAQSATSNALNCSIEGTISHDQWTEGQQSTMTFDRFPANIQEFEQARKQLGTEPQGAVALQVMAFELYRRNPVDGTKALEENNTATNHTSCLRQLKEIMNEQDTYYARPYIAAALLQGSSAENAYAPAEPYQLSMRVNPTRKYQESDFLGGTVIYLQIDSKGWDTNWRGVEVVKPEGGDYYVVSNCPAMYAQCKRIKGTWAGVK